MGMIRVSDEIEQRLKEVSDGRSMSATIEKMLAYCSSPDGFCPVPQEGSYTPLFLEKIFERFDELKALLEDTSVDRLARVQKKKDPISIDWPDVQYLMFELLEEDAPEWTCKEASKGAHESSELEALTWLADEDFIYTTNGTRTNWLTITPRIKSYLGEHYDI